MVRVNLMAGQNHKVMELPVRVRETKRQGRIAHHHADATVPHIVALLGFSFHIAKICISFLTIK
jgi:hypothetical protein